MPPKSIDRIFWDAAQIASPAERQAFLDEACGGDAALQQKVESMLALRSQAEKFLESPPPPLGATSGEQATGFSPSESPGAHIGPYKLLELIGEGGMGTVWMAEQKEPLQRRVALKVIKPGMDSK